MPPPKRRRRRAWCAALASIAGCVTAAACGSAVKAEYSPEAATRAVQKTLGPSPPQLACLEGRFTSEPDIAAVFNLAEKADQEQRDGYVRAIRSCIPIDEFATLLATTAFEAPESGPATITTACVRDTIVALSAPQQDLLYLYFSNPGAVNALEIAPTTKAISDACGLAGGDNPPPGSTPTTALASPSVPS